MPNIKLNTTVHGVFVHQIRNFVDLSSYGQNILFLTCQRKKFLVNQSCISEQIVVWHNPKQFNKLSNNMPNIQFKTIFHGVFVHKSKN